ncbi:MAG: tetratricopeptide repeat protein [Spirochaetota bacterium]
MRKIAFFVLMAVVAVSLSAQNSTFAEYETENYRVLSELGDEHARETAEKLEALLGLYNDYFHFDVGELPVRLRARFFSSKDRYDTYLERVIDTTRDDFVYLHYSDLAKSELVGYEMDAESFDVSLKHQGLIQFMRAFVPNPPLWLREGFAVYFEEVAFDDELGRAVYRENLAWLETLQSIVDGSAGVSPIPLNEMLRLTVDEAREQIEVFYPQAWGMVSFLLNSANRDYNRMIWDSISALEPDASLTENSQAVYEEAFRWEEEQLVIDAFVSYVNDRRSFRTLVQDGIDEYASGELEAAEESFVTALKLREDNFIPYYYMGLINYDRQNYSLADFYYKEALDRGASESLTYYALGVNAYADNRFDDAVAYLEQTISLDPDAYEDKANQLIDRIQG